MKDKMKKEKKKVIEDLTQKFETLNRENKDKELQKDLKAFVNGAKGAIGKEALKRWCNNNLETDLTKDKDNKLWTKIDSRCLVWING